MSGHEDWTVLNRLRSQYPEFSKGVCIDGGSRNMNGSVSFFLGPEVEYIGIDKCGDKDEVSETPVRGVSWHGYIHEYPGNEVADLVTSFNTFEHDLYWKKSITRLIELLKPGGLFVFQLVLSGPQHGEVYAIEDYYGNMNKESVDKLLSELPVGILEDVLISAGSGTVCPVDKFGGLLQNPKELYSHRSFAYLIGRRNAQ